MPHDGNTSERLAEAGHSSHESEFFSSEPPGYVRGRHKYVIVFGTVMSGLGKGIFSSSLAKLIKDKDLTVAPLKMEGYLNIDSGTLNPYRHGEVFVLDDGLETDMDLGTYERMLDQNLRRDNYTTSGQIYRRVLDQERSGAYLGRDVQMIPHVTGEVKRQLRTLAQRQDADVVFVEVGGTAGDHENAFYIEALRQLAFEEGPGSVCYVALTYVIEPPALGEQKSKAAQLGMKKLLEAGVQPHLVAIRSVTQAQPGVIEKIAMFSNVPLERVFSMHDRSSIYTVPDAIRRAGLDRQVLTMLGLHDRVDQAYEDEARLTWSGFVSKLTAPRKYRVRIGITGKYASLRDAYASIDKALEHAGAHLSANVEIQWLDTTQFEPEQAAEVVSECDAVIVPGGFGQRGTESKIACVGYCRTHGVPYLGICLGFQMAVIEFARNVCGLTQASSSEFATNSEMPVIDILPEQKQIEGLGGNMRLGGKDVLITPNTLAAFLFQDDAPTPGSPGSAAFSPGSAASAAVSVPAVTAPHPTSPADPFTIRRRFRHRFEVDPKHIETLTNHGLIFSGRHPDQPIMQVLELPHGSRPTRTNEPHDPASASDAASPTHPYFIGAQFHPELTSRPLHPAPLFMGLVAAAVQHAYPETDPTQISTRWLAPAPEPAHA